MVKADANGKVIDFPDNMIDVPLSCLASTDSSEQASEVTTDYGSAPTNETSPFVVSSEPAFILENLATETGINLPAVKVQAAAAASYNHPLFFAGEVYLGKGTYYLQFVGSGNPFGYYGYLSDANYIFHDDLGHEYIFDANDAGHGVYFYDFKSQDFFYTSPSFPFPYLYDFNLKLAGRYNTDGTRYFYVFNTGQIISK